MPQLSIRRQFLGLVAWLALSFSAAGLGAVASIHAASFYAQLARPEWAPPAYVFGPVWTVLYISMAVAAWLTVSGSTGAERAVELVVLRLAPWCTGIRRYTAVRGGYHNDNDRFLA